MAAPPLVYSRFKAPEAANGTLDVYEAGSLSNRKTTYALPGLTSANTNPVTLNSLGEADVFYSGLAQLVLKDSDGDTIWTKDNIGLGGDTSSEWINSLSATYGSSTTFTLSGDQTTEYHVGRRVRLIGSSTLYGTITISSYSAPNTTVTVSLDSGSIDVTLASTNTGINSATNESVGPSSIFRPTVSGYVSGAITYLHINGGNSGSFDVDANVTTDVFESVGPTGSSATNIWAAMDDMPSSATIAILGVLALVQPSGADTEPVVEISARQTGQSGAVSGERSILRHSFLVDDNLGTSSVQGIGVTAFVPLDSSRRFDIAWVSDQDTASTVTIYLKGFLI